jgi:hypothetical protein
MAKHHSTLQLSQGVQDKCSSWGRALRPSGSCSMGAILTGVGQCHSMNICASTAAAGPSEGQSPVSQHEHLRRTATPAPSGVQVAGAHRHV